MATISGRDEAYGLCNKEVKGIVFALIHYNRVNTLKQALISILGEIRKGDCIILIDNGSPISEQRAALDYFNNKTRHLRDQIQTVTAPIETNQGGIKAYAALLSYLLSNTFPGGKHLVLLGDDDMLVKGWRSEVEPYLAPNDWVAWGYNYFNWNNRKIDKIREHSSRVQVVAGPVAHRQWLSSITGHSEHHGRQEHPSCVAISMQSLRQAAAKIPSLLPMPFADVGLALMINHAANLIYIDKALGLIGRGTNYGMGDADRMAQNHPTRKPILGRPSHSKYAAATYAESLFIINREDLFKDATKNLMWRHLATCYGTSPLKVVKSIATSSKRPLKGNIEKTLEDAMLFISLKLLRINGQPYQAVALRMLGFAKGLSLASLGSIRLQFLSSLGFHSDKRNSECIQ